MKLKIILSHKKLDVWYLRYTFVFNYVVPLHGTIFLGN